MLSQFIEIGNKVELQPLERAIVEKNDSAGQKVYYSTVYEIQSEDTVEITMPIEQTKLVLLPVGGEYNLVFYGITGLYQCFVRVVDRYKNNNVYILVVELISNLRKYQRREYYRFSCALDMCARNLVEEEIKAIEKSVPYELQSDLPLKRSVIVDISGGGLRFVSSQQYEPGSYIYCSYHLLKDNVLKKYEVVGKVLASRRLDNRPDMYEHRVQYHDLDVATREEIIRFIFEEERKNLKKERSL